MSIHHPIGWVLVTHFQTRRSPKQHEDPEAFLLELGAIAALARLLTFAPGGVVCGLFPPAHTRVG